MMQHINYKYILFATAMFLLQIVGYNVVTLAMLLLSLLPIVSAERFLTGIRGVPFYMLFLLLSIVVATYFAVANGLNSWNIPYWGQFYFLCFVLLGVRDKQEALSALRLVVYTLFALDVGTNILLFAGVDVPWAELPPPRPGESVQRYVGVMSNTLYSGCITFLAFCFFLKRDSAGKWMRMAWLGLVVLNLILSHSYRYIILALALAVMYIFRLYRHRLLLLGLYVGSIIVVWAATIATMFFNISNLYRALIWQHYINEISKAPLLGHGLMNMHLKDAYQWTLQWLINNGVTESCILLVAYCFGIPVLLLMLISIVRTLWRYPLFNTYQPELALFMGLTLDLFWGGSFDNSLSLSLLLLSLFLVAERATMTHISKCTDK